jgi:hypothetical protein|tara:strand:+ start:28627 stop:29355 length:729 start_codon:yes stop_codon:yes gene_type:complete
MPTLDKDTYTKAEAEDLLRVQKDEQADALEVANLRAGLTDTEKAHMATLSDEDVQEFLYKSADDRAADVSAAVEDDPVTYKSDEGEEFRKSDDPRMVAMAKRHDADRKEIAKDRARIRNAEFIKRAETDMVSFPGEVSTHVAILKAVDGIADETVREAAQDALKAQNTRLAKADTELGTTADGDLPEGTSYGKRGETLNEAEAKLESLAKAYQKDNPGTNYYDAYDVVCDANPTLLDATAGQ